MFDNPMLISCYFLEHKYRFYHGYKFEDKNKQVKSFSYQRKDLTKYFYELVHVLLVEDNRWLNLKHIAFFTISAD